jgi:hypothetical protein
MLMVCDSSSSAPETADFNCRSEISGDIRAAHRCAAFHNIVAGANDRLNEVFHRVRRPLREASAARRPKAYAFPLAVDRSIISRAATAAALM